MIKSNYAKLKLNCSKDIRNSEYYIFNYSTKEVDECNMFLMIPSYTHYDLRTVRHITG